MVGRWGGWGSRDAYKAQGGREGSWGLATAVLTALLLLGLWELLRTCTHTPSPAPRWPPGPRPLPLVRNLHLLRVAQQDESLMEVGQGTHVLGWALRLGPCRP